MNGWLVLIVWVATSLAMVAGWLWQRRTHNAGVVDVIWTASMAASALFYAAFGTGALLPRVLAGLLGGAWGLRLGWHLAHRVFGEDEDGRYQYLRAHWHDDQRKFLGFFLAQAAFTAIFSLPFLAVASNPRADLNAWTVLGVATFVIALAGEAIADRQLAHWREDPAHRGKTCRAGLWRYSRHPNYFFEIVHWFAYLFLAVGGPAIALVFAALGPVLMLASLYWLTGIPYVEAQALRSRGDDYRDYQRTTSVLLPLPPKD